LEIPSRINLGLTYFHSKRKIRDHVVLNENTTRKNIELLLGEPDKD